MFISYASVYISYGAFAFVFSQLEYEDSGSDSCDQERGVRDRLDLRSIFFSNEEYYAKLEELKKAHLHTMAELENMYHRKLQHHFLDPCHITTQEAEQRFTIVQRT